MLGSCSVSRTHALQDNSDGRPHGFYAAWTYRAPDVRIASEPGELPAQTREHLRQ